MTTDQYRDDLTALLTRLWRYAMVKCRETRTGRTIWFRPPANAPCRATISFRPDPAQRLDHRDHTIDLENDLRRESIRRGAGFVDVEDAVLVDTREPV